MIGFTKRFNRTKFINNNGWLEALAVLNNLSTAWFWLGGLFLLCLEGCGVEPAREVVKMDAPLQWTAGAAFNQPVAGRWIQALNDSFLTA